MFIIEQMEPRFPKYIDINQMKFEKLKTLIGDGGGEALRYVKPPLYITCMSNLFEYDFYIRFNLNIFKVQLYLLV